MSFKLGRLVMVLIVNKVLIGKALPHFNIVLRLCPVIQAIMYENDTCHVSIHTAHSITMRMVGDCNHLQLK